jgi:NADH-quinone oxidoreductase subunit C
MTPTQIAQTLSNRFEGKITASFPADKHPRVHANTSDWLPIAQFLREEPSLSFDWLQCLSGVDYVADGKLCVVYDLWSFDHRHTFAVKVFCPRDDARVPSVVRLWSAADWQEREAYDMFGIVFEGHPDLRRILCADDWEGFPLLKDYVFPREYHGIPASVELDWQQKPDYPQGHV